MGSQKHVLSATCRHARCFESMSCLLPPMSGRMSFTESKHSRIFSRSRRYDTTPTKGSHIYIIANIRLQKTDVALSAADVARTVGVHSPPRKWGFEVQSKNNAESSRGGCTFQRHCSCRDTEKCKYVCTRAPNPNDTLKGDSDRVLSRGLVSQILHHPVSDHVSYPAQQRLFNGLLQPAAAVEIRSAGVAHTCPGCTDPARGPACTHGTARPAHPRLFHPCRGHRRPRRSRPSGGGGVRRGCGRARPSRRQPSFASSRTTETLFSAIGEREGSTLVSSSWRRQ